MIYLYALLDGRIRQLPRRGIRGGPIRLVRCPGGFAAVEDVRSLPVVSARTLRAHDRVVRDLAQRAKAVAPVRFAMALGDEETLIERASLRAQDIGRLFELIRGREQMTLRVFADDPGLKPWATGSGEPARSGEVTGAGKRSDRRGPRSGAPFDTSVAQAFRPAGGTAHVGEGTRYLVSRAVGVRELDGALEEIRKGLSGLVCAERLEQHGPGKGVGSLFRIEPSPRKRPPTPFPPRRGAGRLVANVYHLIARGESAAYAAIADELGAGGSGLRLAISGPTPCYAFADEVRI